MFLPQLWIIGLFVFVVHLYDNVLFVSLYNKEHDSSLRTYSLLCNKNMFTNKTIFISKSTKSVGIVEDLTIVVRCVDWEQWTQP